MATADEKTVPLEEKDTQLKAECEQLIASGALAKALQNCLTALARQNTGPKTKEVAMDLGVRAMENLKAEDIAKFVDTAENSLLDAAIKCVYFGMAKSVKGTNCSNLLTWHGKITDKAGIGCIMRAMCDKPFEK